MKFVGCLLACCLVLPCAAQSLAQTSVPPPPASTTLAPPPAGNPSAHTGLTGDVMQKLTNDPSLGAITITVNVTDDGVVGLNGVVPTQQLADQAVTLVKTVPGVQSVKSQLMVNEDVFSPPSAASGASLPGRSEAAVSNPVVPPANDPQMRMEQALQADPALARVSVSVYGQRATLIGSVASKSDVKRAVQLARKTLPEFQQANLLWVDPHPLAPPPLVPR